jgi:Domain of unknown function (DUF892)
MEDLLIHGLQDIYYAEQQILKALPKMHRAHQFDEIYSAFPREHPLLARGADELLRRGQTLSRAIAQLPVVKTLRRA